MNVHQRRANTRSPVLAILASLVAGAVLAVALVLGPASGGSEPMITGSVLFAFGLGWGLMALLSTRYSAQPQTWMVVPAMFLGIIGLGLIVFQPGPAAMDLLSWIWPPALAVLAVWMFMQVRRNLHGRGRWLVVPVIATLLLIAVGGAVATVTAATGRTAQSASGQMIDVGGHRLYIECHGSGSPVVVLQIGLGGTAADWGRIAPAVSASTTVCAYDRAGHGWSEGPPGPRTASPSPRTCTPCSSVPGSPGPTSSSVTPRVDHTCGCSRLDIPTTSPAWCSSTHSRPTRSPRCPTTRPSTARTGPS